ncbi:MAG TPA: response regulator [Candidatus Acidoferrum sp.]|jgi:two-component system chemotaxis sensor kinase CheA
MAKDQYKYFRIEARELLEGLGQTVLQLERDGSGPELVGKILRLAHTLKGASRVVKQPGIAELAHAVESAFERYRNGEAAVSRESTDHVLSLLDKMAIQVAALDSPAMEQQGEAPRAITEEVFETVRVEIEEMDTLLGGVSEAGVQLTALRREIETTFEHTRHLADSLLGVLPAGKAEANGSGGAGPNAKTRAAAEELRSQLERLRRNLAGGIDQVEAEFAQIRDAANRLRLLPAAAIFSSLERAVRDAAQSLHKDVVFATFGGEYRLDAHVLAALRDALLHVVRNAVAHGIESRDERNAAGKAVSGCVELHVERRSNRVAFICRDDGRGIDVDAIRRVAIQRGLLRDSDGSSLGLQEVVQIIMQGGVTTTGAVDQVSGRGIGLDVVRETAARFKGEVAVLSEPGRGTSLEICVPVSLSSIAALEVDSGGIVAAIPLDAVRQTLRLAEHDISHGAEMDSIVHQGKALPFLVLHRALRRKSVTGAKRRLWSGVVLQSSSGTAAVGVDRLLGVSSVVMRTLPSLAAVDGIVLGAALNAEGDPQLILDPEGLVALARRGRVVVSEEAPAKRLPILVIDDSLTTRMLEQSILESAGYEVEAATSAEEALDKARGKQYSLFLVDVEMPGMSGFEFVSRTRADARLSSVPAILVTSRNAAEDRRRGEEAGARAYIVKGEFDQGYLLRMTRELVG